MSHPISRTEAEESITGPLQEVDDSKDKALTQGERERVEIEGRRQFFSLRRLWSGWIIAWITSLIVFNCLLALMIGNNELNFENMQWFITAVTVETFLQVVGLGYVAAKYLFSNG